MIIDKKDFNNLIKQYENEDMLRESIIKKSRDILKASKQAIYSVHRNEMKKAEQNLKLARKIMDDMQKLATKAQSLESVGAYNDAASEFSEAYCFYHYIKSGKVATSSEVKTSNESYLLGLCDLTGELGRRAVILATNKKFREVSMIRDVVEEIYGEFLKFNFRNSELRKKSDSIKWNLKKIEEITYDIEIKKK